MELVIVIVFIIQYLIESRKKRRDPTYNSWIDWDTHWDHWNHRKYGD